MSGVWWCSWTFPLAHRADERIAATWPKGVHGWRSGESEDREVWCGRIVAPSRDAAVALVGEMYGALSNHVRWRFGPDEKAADWWPNSSRFPRPVSA